MARESRHSRFSEYSRQRRSIWRKVGVLEDGHEDVLEDGHEDVLLFGPAFAVVERIPNDSEFLLGDPFQSNNLVLECLRCLEKNTLENWACRYKQEAASIVGIVLDLNDDVMDVALLSQ